MASTAHTFALDPARNYTTFEPRGWKGSGKAPRSLPVVVFMHGYLGIDPSAYASWIEHTVRDGNVLIYPAYQAHAYTPPSTYTDNAIWSVRDALARLEAESRFDLDLDRGVFLQGHSYGGPIMANYANRAASEGLPRAAGILFGEPWWQTIDPDLSGIPASTRILCLVGEDDTLAGRRGCDLLWDRTPHVGRRNYVLLRSDGHGDPAVEATHRVPSDYDPAGLNALDWFGYWKLSDALRDCSLRERSCRYAFGNTWQQTFMGRWDDGRLFNRLWVYGHKPPDPFPGAHPPAPLRVRVGAVRLGGRAIRFRLACTGGGERVGCHGRVTLSLAEPVRGLRHLGSVEVAGTTRERPRTVKLRLRRRAAEKLGTERVRVEVAGRVVGPRGAPARVRASALLRRG